MDVVIEEVSSATRRMKFVLRGDEVGNEVSQITREMAKTVSVPGFRKGRVPAAVVKRKFSDQIQNDAIISLVGDRVKAAMKERDITPIRQPYIENYAVADESEDYEITVSYEVYPEVDDPTLTGEELVNPIVELSEADIDKVIERWHVAHQAYETIEGPITKGDQVHASIELFADGESKWGQAQQVVLNTGDTDENNLQEITDACIDKQAGDKFTVTVVDTVLAEPGESSSETESEVNQIESQFEVEVVRISRPKPGQFNEEFLERLGVAGPDDKNFRTRARAEIETQWQRERERILRDQALTLLLQRNSFIPPESIISRQLMEYLKSNGLGEQQIVTEMKQGIESPLMRMTYAQVVADLKFSMIFERIQSDRNIEFDESEIDEIVADKMQNAPLESAQQSEPVYRMMMENIRQASMVEYQRNKLVDAVLEDVSKVDQTMGLDDFEAWAESVRKSMQAQPDQALESDQPVDSESEEVAPQSDMSVIVDTAGNPIDKSKSE